jgi:hypothetical protein
MRLVAFDFWDSRFPRSQNRVMTYLSQQEIKEHWAPIPSNRDHEQHRRLRDREIASFRLSACALCRTELNAPRIVRPLPWNLEALLYRIPRVYGFVAEMHSFLHRMVARYRRRYGPYFVSGIPLSELGEGGVRRPNTRMCSCTDDMRNYAVNHPWATTLDLETYRDAWLAGAEWASRNSCTPDMATSAKSPNHP